MSEAGRLRTKADRNLLRLLDEYEAQMWRSHLDIVEQLPGVGSALRRIANALEREQLCDYLAEVRYASVIVELGFGVQFEPLGRKGPDLGISRNGHDAVVEVKRLRHFDPGPPSMSFFDEERLEGVFLLEDYGNPERLVRRIVSHIGKKLRQVGNSHSIIAFWNEDEGDIETEVAVRELRSDTAQQEFILPAGLLFILYGSGWQRPGKQFRCFPFRELGEPQSSWIRDLENFSAQAPIRRSFT